MTTVMKRYTKGVVLKGETTDVTENAEGSLFQNSSELRLKAYIEGAVRQIVTNTQSQVLTNKTIDADNNSVSNIQTSNLKSGVLNTSTTLSGASNTQLPSALAVKTYIDDKAAAQNEASEISFVPVGTIAATNVQAMGQELDGDIQSHITNVSGAHAASAISNIPSGNLAATTVQAALNELQGDVDTRATSSDLTNHTTASANVHGIGVGNSVVGTGTSQALTNKTIDADLNTISNIDNADIKANAGIDATKIADGSVSNAEFQTLDGVTSAIQTQLNSKVNASGGTLTNGSIVTPVRSDVKQDTKANLTTYALTATNGQLAFATDTKEMFQVVDAALVPVGSGGAEGDVDSLLVQNFETAALTDFTQTGLTLTATNPIRGEISARLVHQPAVNQSFKQTIPVDRKFRGIPMTVALSARSTAAAGDLIIQFRDETNNINLQESQQIIATSTIQTFQFGVTIPSDCDSFSYTITALPEAGSPESVIDDIVIRNYWMGTANLGQTEYQFEVPVVTQWQSYTPTFQGLGSPTNIEMEWRQNGENIEIRGKLAVGTVTADQARIGLPSTYQVASGTTGVIAVGRVIRLAGGSAYEKDLSFLTQAGLTYLGMGVTGDSGTGDPSVLQNASSILGAGNNILVNASVKVSGLTATTTKKVVSTDLVPAKALSGNASFSVPNVTAWQGYTPTFQGFGTPTNIEFEWRQSGESVEIRGKFISGTPTAVEARVGLPGGLTSAGTSLIPSIQLIGYGQRAISTTQQYGVLIEPSVTHMTFSAQGTTSGVTKRNATDLVNGGDTFSFFASIPCAGLTATKTETIGLAQSLLVQEADSTVRLDTANGYGSTGTKIRRFTSIRDQRGTDITYIDDAVNGARFVVNTAGIYDVSFTDSTSGSVNIGISLNSTNLATNISTLNTNTNNEILSYSSVGAATTQTANWSGYLNVGDIIRPHTDGQASADVDACKFTIARQGSLKQLNPNPNQKITIPTSELRMEGASTRGSTATAIVRFDNIAKIRGDAFTVESDATLGTRIVMKKKGKLDVGTSIALADSTIYITLNQSSLTAAPTQAESLASSENASSRTKSCSASVFVNVGDVIRVNSAANPISSIQNNINLAFQEQDISVSVTNTLPQFSESDSSVRVDTANGYGSTGTRIRRFSNVRDNIGNDIEYVPSSVNGDSFVVKSAGIYHISYSDNFVSAGTFGISLNAPIATNFTSLTSAQRLADSTTTNTTDYGECVSGSFYLNVGDVVRAHTDGTASGGSGPARSIFTISKVGKPNVTGVDVTPFVNIPQQEKQSLEIDGGSTATLSNVTLAPSRQVGSGIFRYTQSTGEYLILKPCSIFLSVTFGTTNSAPDIQRNGVTLANDRAATNDGGTASTMVEAVVGDVFRFRNNTSLAASGLTKAQVFAVANSDSIITPNESFSTDTANLVYAPSSLYTLATLSNAPVGTFITFTYAANTNTRTQTTTAPTQTTADMNVNGIRLFTRVYASTSTANEPSAIAIQIGKGLKGRSLDLYKSVGKSIAGTADFAIVDSASQRGLYYKDYNESTGILVLDAGVCALTTISSNSFNFSDVSGQTNGYLVINASKSPALTGVPLVQPRIATIKDVKAQGTNAGASVTGGVFTTRVLNTLEDPTGLGVSISSNQIILQPGSYYIEAKAPGNYANTHRLRLRNITDSVTTILGMNNVCQQNTTQLDGSIAELEGHFTLSSVKTFEIQHYFQTTYAGPGLGQALNVSGESEVYTTVKLQRIK